LNRGQSSYRLTAANAADQVKALLGFLPAYRLAWFRQLVGQPLELASSHHRNR